MKKTHEIFIKPACLLLLLACLSGVGAGCASTKTLGNDSFSERMKIAVIPGRTTLLELRDMAGHANTVFILEHEDEIYRYVHYRVPSPENDYHMLFRDDVLEKIILCSLKMNCGIELTEADSKDLSFSEEGGRILKIFEKAVEPKMEKGTGISLTFPDRIPIGLIGQKLVTVEQRGYFELQRIMEDSLAKAIGVTPDKVQEILGYAPSEIFDEDSAFVVHHYHFHHEESSGLRIQSSLGYRDGHLVWIRRGGLIPVLSDVPRPEAEEDDIQFKESDRKL